MTSNSRTAGCGPACPVVWQGCLLLLGAPYADSCRLFFLMEGTHGRGHEVKSEACAVRPQSGVIADPVVPYPASLGSAVSEANSSRPEMILPSASGPRTGSLSSALTRSLPPGFQSWLESLAAEPYRDAVGCDGPVLIHRAST